MNMTEVEKFVNKTVEDLTDMGFSQVDINISDKYLAVMANLDYDVYQIAYKYDSIENLPQLGEILKESFKEEKQKRAGAGGE